MLGVRGSKERVVDLLATPRAVLLGLLGGGGRNQNKAAKLPKIILFMPIN